MLGWWILAIFFGFDCSAALDPAKTITQYHQDLWTTDQGLPQNDVLAIAQTPDGYLWIATEKGLVRFDGLSFTVFDSANTPSLKVSTITALLVDHTGDLWIGSQGGGVNRLHQQHFTAYDSRSGLSNDVVNALLEDRQGNIWLATGQGLAKLRDGRFSLFRDGILNNDLTSLALGSDGAIWIGTHQGLVRFANGSFRTFTMADGLANNYVKQLFYDRADQLWIATNGGGLSRWRDGEFVSINSTQGLKSNSLSSVYVDQAGTVWIGSFGGGVARLIKNTVSTYTSKQGLAYDDIRCFFEDRYGDLWIGTGGGGLHRLSNGRLFTTYGVREGLSAKAALGIFQDSAGDFWVGTNGGGLNRIHNESISSVQKENGLADNLVFSIAQTADGDLWVGSKGGLDRFHKGIASLLTEKDGLAGGAVLALLVDRADAVWVGSRLGLSVIKDRKIQRFTTANGLSDNRVQALYQDHDGVIWIGTAAGGVNRFADGKFTSYRAAQGLSSDVIDSFFEDEEHTLWIGTDTAGLNRFKNGKFVSFTMRDGFPDNTVNRIFADASDYLWISSGRGVFRVQRRELNDYADKKISALRIVSYGIPDGMKSTDCNGGFSPAGWQGKDGRFWIPTMEGVAVVDPKKAGVGDPPPAVLLEAALVDGQRMDADSSTSAKPGRGQLEFHYTSPNFSSPLKTIFRYRLEGFDRTWVDAGHRRTAFYTNIPPGNYRFAVAASNGDGQWGAVQSTSIHLAAHFYQTWWFRLLCIAAMFGISLVLYAIKIHQHELRERVLEVRVAQRTTDLRREIADRERTEEELVKAKNAAEEANRVKSEFLANMSHEIRTPMNGIVGMTDLAMSTKLTPEQYEYLGLIKYSSDSLLNVINDILDFSKVEAGKLDFDPVLFHLRQSLEETLRLVAFRAHQKGLEIACVVADSVPEYIEADPTRLRQIVLNLLSNAVKFTEQGEVVMNVDASVAKAGAIELHVTVQDTGIGIPEGKRESIFEAFSQADNSTTRRFGGTGLGLAICQQLVRLMTGKIWVDSSEGVGSSFHFVIPVVAPPQRVGQDEAMALGLSALVVEKHAVTRAIIRNALAGWGATVATAESVLEAERMIAPFHLLVLDVQAATDGECRKLLGRIQAAGANKPAVILVQNSATKPIEKWPGDEMGFHVCITKPIRKQQLHDAVMAVRENLNSPPVLIHHNDAIRKMNALRILLVEDNLVNQRLSTRLLEKRGHSVLAVGDGISALAALTREQFDLALMDIQMPGMDGFQVTSVIRKQELEKGGHLTIIAMTAHVSKGDEDRCLAAGMDAYFPKPFNPNLLFAAIDRLCSHASAASA